MGQKSGPAKEPAEQVIREIRRSTRRQFSAEEEIRIVLSGLRGEDSIAELCRREGIVQNLYYRWSKEFPRAGKTRLAGDTARAATSDEVKECPSSDLLGQRARLEFACYRIFAARPRCYENIAADRPIHNNGAGAFREALATRRR